MSGQTIRAWDSTLLEVAHGSPGDTIVDRLGVCLEGFVTVQGKVLVPAQMDPVSAWAVEASTGEVANLVAAREFLARGWDEAGACVSYGGIDVAGEGQWLYRWEVWNASGQLVDLVLTPVAQWSSKALRMELRRAGWRVVAGAADPLREYPEHRDVTGEVVRVMPGAPFRWLMPEPGGQRQWPVEQRAVSSALFFCRGVLGLAGLRVASDLYGARHGEGDVVRAEAALVGVVDRHLSQATFPAGRVGSLCSCGEGDARDVVSGHAPWCACHEPELLQAHYQAQFGAFLTGQEHHV